MVRTAISVPIGRMMWCETVGEEDAAGGGDDCGVVGTTAAGGGGWVEGRGGRFRLRSEPDGSNPVDRDDLSPTLRLDANLLRVAGRNQPGDLLAVV